MTGEVLRPDTFSIESTVPIYGHPLLYVIVQRSKKCIFLQGV